MSTSCFKTFLEKSPTRELAYRAALWIVLAWVISSQALYILDDSVFPEAVKRYISGISNWDKLAALAMVTACVVYALRSLEFSIYADRDQPRGTVACIVGTLAKVSGDVSLAAFGAGVAVFVTVSRLPTRLESDAAGFIKLGGTLSVFSLFLAVTGVCYLISREPASNWLYRWQQHHPWAARYFLPAASVALVLFYSAL